MDNKTIGIILLSLAGLSVLVIFCALLQINYYGVNKSSLSPYFVKLNKDNKIYLSHTIIFALQFIFIAIGSQMIMHQPSYKTNTPIY